MTELKICRVCLRTAVKMYRFDQYYLKSYYEEVMATKIDYIDSLPPYFCYECAALLYKFHKFKQKCATGQKVLLEMLWEQPISYEIVNKINKRLHNLESDLEIMTITKLVKAYAMKQEPKEIIHSDEIKNTEIIEEEKDKIVEDQEDQKPISDQLPFIEDDNFDNHYSDLDETACKEEPGSPESPDSPPLSVYKELKAVMAKNESNKKNKKESKKDSGKKSKKGLLRSEKVVQKRTRKKREKVDNHQNKKRSSPYKKEKIRFLDMTVWKIHNLTEEEGEAEFKRREHDPKYLKAEFHCVNCFRGFSKQYMLERHNQVRHVESIGRWQCRLCHMRFKINSNLKKHYGEHFVKYECIKCGLVCWSESHAFVHEEKHKGVKRKCQHCDREFRHLSTYYTHLRMSHRSEHLCNQCGASFVSKLGLHLHKQKCKAKAVTKEEAQEAQPAESSTVLDMETYCEKCDIRFETKLAFEEHLQNSVLHEEGFENCKRKQEDDEMDYVEPLPFKKRHMFPRKESAPNQDTKLPFKSHLPYRKTKPTTCYQCGKSFETQAAAMKHHKEAHPGTSFCPPNERCICEICGASLAPGSVQAHENRHYKKKLFTCNTCGRTFLTSMVLKRHMVVHTGEKPYKCTLCDKRFTQPGSMQLHYKTFHLKQPYPPRNRHKKLVEEEPSTLHLGESSNEQDPRLQPVRFSHYLLTQQKYM